MCLCPAVGHPTIRDKRQLGSPPTGSLPWILRGMLGSPHPMMTRFPMLFGPMSLVTTASPSPSAEFSYTYLKNSMSHVHNLDSYGNGAKE